MSQKLHFVHLDVFTATRYLGNPLAIVHVPEGAELSQSQKQKIAAEFNLAETVFLHENSDSNAPVVIDIFTTKQELPFAGHPTIGSGYYLLSQASGKDTITLRTKAGDIPVIRDGQGVKLQVPTNFKIHDPTIEASVKSAQPLKDNDYVNGTNGPEPIASIVKGMTFVLLQVASEEALAAIQPYPKRFSVPALGDWASFVGIYAFFEREDGVVRTRMFDGPLEDPATGSAASTLAGWLAKKKGQGKWKIEIVQGVEMGRKSYITVEVEIGSDGQVGQVDLAGAAVEVMEGSIRVE